VIFRKFAYIQYVRGRFSTL